MTYLMLRMHSLITALKCYILYCIMNCKQRGFLILVSCTAYTQILRLIQTIEIKMDSKKIVT